MKPLFRYVVLCAVILVGLRPTAAAADDPNRAVLIVAHGDGHLTTHCISFGEGEISGAEVLRRSGLSVRFTEYLGFGAGVCAIDGEGCPLEHEDCFCQCKGTPCSYWSYWHWCDGRWFYSQVGASSYNVHDGGIEGWIWGDGQSPPPLVPFEQVCVPTQTPIPTDTSAPTPLPTDTPLPTPIPSNTPVPSNTPQPPPPARPEPSGTSMPSPRDTRTPTAQATATQLRSATPMSTKDTQTSATVTEPAVATRPTTIARPVLSPTATLAPTSQAEPLVRTPTRAATELTASVTTTPKPSMTAPPVATTAATSEHRRRQDAPLGQYAAFATMATILVAGFLLLHRRSRE